MIDLWITYQFLRKLTTPFSEWPAYKVGVIDENGVILKKAKNRLSKEEQASFTKFDLLVLKFKTLLEKIPGGNTKFGSYTTALWLIKENSATSFNELYSNQQQQYFQKLIDYTTSESVVNSKLTLSELFDHIYPITWKVKSRTNWIGTFHAVSDIFTVTFDFSSSKGWIISFRGTKGGFGTENRSGDQFKIFSSVLSAIDKFITEVQPLKLTFSGTKTESKASLYDRFVKKFADGRGYTFRIMDNQTEHEYILVQKPMFEEIVNNVSSGSIAGTKDGISYKKKKRVKNDYI